MKLNMSLQNKIFSIFIFVIILSVSIIGWYGYTNIKESYISSAYEINKQGTDSLDLEIEKYLSLISKDVLYSKDFYALKRYLIFNSKGEEKKAKQWKKIFTDSLIYFLETKKDYYKARIIDLNGDELISVRYKKDINRAFLLPSNQLQNKKGRSYVEIPKGLKKDQFYISELNLNIENGRIERPFTPVIRYSTPMVNANGDLTNIFVISVYAQNILDIISKQEVEQKNRKVNYFLIDPNGNYIYHKDKNKRWGAQLKNNSNFNQDHFQIDKYIQDKISGVFTYNHKIYSFHKITPLKSEGEYNYWYIISSVDTDVALSKLQNFKIIFFILIFFILIGSFILVRLYISRFVTPLTQVSDQLKALSKGQIQKRDIKYDSNDEIKDIVVSTSKVIEAIETTINQANSVSNGDFTHDIELLSKNDQLGLAIKEMTKRLKDITSISTKLAKGDYDVTVIPKSSDDQIGIAAQNTIKYYKDITALAESIANGNIDLEYKLKSDDDRIGRAILEMVQYLKNILNQANAITNNNFDTSIEIKGKDDELGLALVAMTDILRKNYLKNKDDIWFSEGLSNFSDKLTGIEDTLVLAKKAITMACRYVKGSSGVLYAYDKDENNLNLIASFAYISRNKLSNKFALGEGVIGQVALEKEPILLKNIKDDEFEIQSGTTVAKPKEVFTFPLIHDEELFGVVEIMSFEGFTKLQRNYLLKAASIFATALHSTTQNAKIKILLEESQKAYEELQLKSEEMQAQSEELRASNEQMEEQQAQLQIQSANLEIKNVELNRAKKEIDKKAADLEASNKYKSEFLANMSHELRTPLNSIILLSSLLAKNSKDNLVEQDIQKAKVINQSGNELLRLINDILDLSKIESGKMELIVDRIQSEDLVNYYTQTFSHMAQEKGLEFKVIDNIKGEFYNDQDRLGQIIRNLISNAFKFTKQGGITLTFDKTDDPKLPIKISVSDTGLGIPKEKQDLIFQAFTQADGSTSRQFGGTGLGLSISKELAKLMKGKIHLESKENEGSVFTILLPSLKDEYKGSNIAITRPKEIKVTDTIINKKENIESIKKQFLVIEDDINFANILKETIQENNAKVFLAHNGEDGLKLAKEHNIDGAIIDIGLPDISGIEVIKRLKNDPLTANIHIQVISGQDKNIDNFINLKIDGYLQKPVSSEQINHILSTLESIKDKNLNSILIVEDDELHLKAIKDYIQEDNNFNITTASSINKAKELIDTQFFDLAIVDLGLNDGSGSEVCTYLTQTKKDTAILIYTGRDLTNDEADFLNEISDEIIIKNPNSHERLKDEINRFLTSPTTVNEKFAKHIKEIDYSDGNLEDLKGKSVLIVDDDIKNIFVLTSALQEYDMHINHAKNGQEAIEFLEENPNINIVLMDIMMPIMDGYEAIKKIRAINKIKNIPIIAVTAKAMQKDKDEAIAAGADDYLTKPIDLEKLSAMISIWINK